MNVCVYLLIDAYILFLVAAKPMYIQYFCMMCGTALHFPCNNYICVLLCIRSWKIYNNVLVFFVFVFVWFENIVRWQIPSCFAKKSFVYLVQLYNKINTGFKIKLAISWSSFRTKLIEDKSFCEFVVCQIIRLCSRKLNQFAEVIQFFFANFVYGNHRWVSFTMAVNVKFCINNFSKLVNVFFLIFVIKLWQRNEI